MKIFLFRRKSFMRLHDRVYISQLIKFARVCSQFDDFSARNNVQPLNISTRVDSIINQERRS